MNRSLSCILVLVLLFCFYACSSKVPLDRSGMQAKNVLAVLNDMSKFYETKNLSSFTSNISERYVDRESFSNSLASLFTKYEAIHFKIYHTKMLIVIQENGQIKVSCNWDAEWFTSGGTSQKGGGRVTFIFEQNTTKLLAIEGPNPFIPIERPIRPQT